MREYWSRLVEGVRGVLKGGLSLSLALLAVAVFAHGCMSMRAAETASRSADQFTVELRHLNESIPAIDLGPLKFVREALDLPPLLDTIVTEALDLPPLLDTAVAEPRVGAPQAGRRRWRWFRDPEGPSSELVRLNVESWGKPISLSKEMVIDAIQGLLRQEISLFEDRFNVVMVDSGEHHQRPILIDKVLGYAWVMDETGDRPRFDQVEVQNLLQIQTPQSPLSDLVQSLVDQIPGVWVAERSADSVASSQDSIR